MKGEQADGERGKEMTLAREWVGVYESILTSWKLGDGGAVSMGGIG
jgi:hypothetical protein